MCYDKENTYLTQGGEVHVTVYDQIYRVVCDIPKGKVATYGLVAALVGNPRLSRVVGYALHVNPRPGEIPCHRVVNRFGCVANSFAFGGAAAQRALLAAEGIQFDADGCVDLKRFGWCPEDYEVRR